MAPTPCVIKTVTRRQSKNTAAHDKIVQQFKNKSRSHPNTLTFMIAKMPHLPTHYLLLLRCVTLLLDLQGNSVQTVVEEIVDLSVPVVLQRGEDKQSFINEVRNDPTLLNLRNTADKRELDITGRIFDN